MYCLGEALEQKLSWCPDWKRQVSPICHRIAGPYPENAYCPQHPKICLHVLLTKTKQTNKKEIFTARSISAYKNKSFKYWEKYKIKILKISIIPQHGRKKKP